MKTLTIAGINCTITIAPTTAPDHIGIVIPQAAAILNMEQVLELSSALENIVNEYKRDTLIDLNSLRAGE